MLKIGDMMPDFEVVDQDGNEVSSKDLIGKRTIIGVSKDSAASHRKFADKYELPFTLLSDTSTLMLQTFGAWGEKKMYGKTVMGAIRRTFIFDENGILKRIIEKVDTKNLAIMLPRSCWTWDSDGRNPYA